MRSKLVIGLALAAGLALPSAAAAKTTLVEVQSTSPAVINQLEALGLDVTYEARNRTELMLHGPEDRQILENSKTPFKVLDEDIDGANDKRLATEATQQRKVDGACTTTRSRPRSSRSFTP